MLFLFSIETLIEWLNIHPILFFLSFIMASLSVFSIIEYIKQLPEQKSWWKAIFQSHVFYRLSMSIIVFLFLFILYIVAIVPDYRVIAITDYKEKQFDNRKLKPFVSIKKLEALSLEIQGLIGDQYRVIIDKNVKPEFKNSRLIIVPGIFNKVKALETLMKLEERIEFFNSSNEETEIPTLISLWKEKIHKNTGKKNFDIKFIKSQIGFMGHATDLKENSWVDQQWNKVKFILNFYP